MQFRFSLLLLLSASALVPTVAAQSLSTPSGKSIRTAALTKLIEQRMAGLNMAGLSLAVIRDGKVAYRRHFGFANAERENAIDDETLFEGASMTKPVFAYLALRLVDRGLLDLDAPLHKYLPYPDIANDERYKQITARHVLTHQTGFPNWRYGRPLFIQFDPGSGFCYSGEGFVYLGKVLESLTRMPLHDLAKKEVFDPIGMERTTLVWSPKIDEQKASGHYRGDIVSQDYYRPRVANPAASLLSNTEDFGRFMLHVTQRNGLKPATYEEMFRAQAKPKKGSTHQNARGTISWGLGWVIEKTPWGDKCQHGGNNGDFESYFEISRDRKDGYVYFSNSDQGDELNAVLKPFLTSGKRGEAKTKRLDSSNALPFTAAHWNITGRNENAVFKGGQGLYLTGNNRLDLKSRRYKNFIAEFDVAFDPGNCSAGLLFRMQDKDNYENFYLRAHESGNEAAMQYTPVFNGTSAWQLCRGVNYRRSAVFRKSNWMRVRVAVFGDWMEVFLDGSDDLALHVFDLKHAPAKGDVALWCDSPCYVSDFRIREVAEYKFFYNRQPKPTPEHGTVRTWLISSAFPDERFDIQKPGELSANLKWVPLTCEYDGLVNIARVAKRTEKANAALATFTIVADDACRRRLQFGYSDIAKVLLNGKVLYEGQNLFGSRDADYLGTIGYFDNVWLDLNKGKNEVLIEVIETFGGWGIMAKLDDMNGIELTIRG